MSSLWWEHTAISPSFVLGWLDCEMSTAQFVPHGCSSDIRMLVLGSYQLLPGDGPALPQTALHLSGHTCRFVEGQYPWTCSAEPHENAFTSHRQYTAFVCQDYICMFMLSMEIKFDCCYGNCKNCKQKLLYSIKPNIIQANITRDCIPKI